MRKNVMSRLLMSTLLLSKKNFIIRLVYSYAG